MVVQATTRHRVRSACSIYHDGERRWGTECDIAPRHAERAGPPDAKARGQQLRRVRWLRGLLAVYPATTRPVSQTEAGVSLAAVPAPTPGKMLSQRGFRARTAEHHDFLRNGRSSDSICSATTARAGTTQTTCV